MSADLLGQFIAEEATPDVRSLILGAYDDGRGGSGPIVKRFEFNRFEVTMDLDKGIIVLEDVLDASELGTQEINISEFVEALTSA